MTVALGCTSHCECTQYKQWLVPNLWVDSNPAVWSLLQPITRHNIEGDGWWDTFHSNRQAKRTCVSLLAQTHFESCWILNPCSSTPILSLPSLSQVHYVYIFIYAQHSAAVWMKTFKESIQLNLVFPFLCKYWRVCTHVMGFTMGFPGFLVDILYYGD